MSLLHLAAPEDLPRLSTMVAALHGEIGLNTSEDHRTAALNPILNGLPHGAIWLIGPRRAPVGYLAISFGWSLEFGGLDAVLDEFYIRDAVRGRGMGGEALNTLAKTLAEAGVKALHLEVDSSDEAAQRLYNRALFRPRTGYATMTRVL